MSLGIEPVAMIGHSVGEFVAAVLAGVMRLEDALPVVAARGRLMQELPAGTMLAVRLPEAELRALLPPGCAIAAVNGPALSVASGPEDAIAGLEGDTQLARGAQSRRLHTSHAFHSSDGGPDHRAAASSWSACTYPFHNAVRLVRDRHVDHRRRRPRRLTGHGTHARPCALRTASTRSRPRSPAPILLEVGPGNVTTTLALQTLQGRTPGVVTSLQDAARERSDRDCVLEALGRLWTLGAEPRWEALHGVPRRRVPLPTYPFERKRYWIEAPPRTTGVAAPLASAASAPAPEEIPVAPASVAAAASEGTDRIAAVSATIAAILEQLSRAMPPPSLTERDPLPGDGLRLALPHAGGTEDPGPAARAAHLPSAAARVSEHPGTR